MVNIHVAYLSIVAIGTVVVSYAVGTAVGYHIGKLAALQELLKQCEEAKQ